MSPLLQKHRPPSSPETPTSSRSPQTWFRPANNRSLSSLTKAQHPQRPFGFSSIRSSSRQTTRTLSTTTYQQPYSHGCSPPRDGPLRDLKAAKGPEFLLPSGSRVQQSRSSSVESLPIDKSGFSSDSTYATTPSPAKHRAFQLLASTSPVQRKGMGNKASTVLRKPMPLEGKRSSATVTREIEDPPASSHQQVSTRSQQPATFSARGSSVMLNVPRRRSSLTVLHLDSSHFETPDPQHQTLDHRASTLTEPRRRSSNLPEKLRPATIILPSSSDTTPMIQLQQRETLSPVFLSPPLLSPPLSTSQFSSASSQALSFKSQNSGVPTFIHLPKTYPDGPIPVPAPPLTITHRKCYQSHRRVVMSRNKYNPVPCMTCGEREGEARWKCIWCALRICGSCMADFDTTHRNLDKFLAGLEKSKEGKNGGGGKNEVQELDSGREQIESQKEKALSKRESQRLSIPAQVKLLTTSK